MMIEKTRMPSGSRRRRPTGNLCCNLRILHCTSLLVVQMIEVHRRSRAESTRDAMSESDDELKAAMTLAMRRTTLAITLIYCTSVLPWSLRERIRQVTLMAHFALLSPFRLCSRSSSGSRGSMSPPFRFKVPPFSRRHPRPNREGSCCQALRPPCS